MSTLKPFTEATTEFEKDTPWNTTALNMAVAHDTSMTGTVGSFITEPTKTTSTGTRRSRFQLNAESRVARIVPTFSGTVPPDDCRPKIRYTTAEVRNAGTVVHMRWRMCVNRFTPVARDAMFVVSDRGESLSPK